MTPRRILLALGFGLPALVLFGLLAYVVVVGPPEALRSSEKDEATPTATWVGPTRAPADCPEFFGTGAELFDRSLYEDLTTLDPLEHGREVVQVGRQRIALRKVSYFSYEMVDCRLEKVRMIGILAMPVGLEKNRSGRLPGVLRLHGLLPHEERRDVLELSAALKAAVLAIYGPGFDLSHGTDSRPDHYFDVASDPRRSWQWAYTVAALRGITFLAQRAEIDASRLGVLGYSAGGMAALTAAGVDKRVKATVAWSASGHLELSAQAEPVPGWYVALLEGMNPPRTKESPEWKAFLRTLDPKLFLPTVTTPVFLINGTQDQYYPIDATARTYDDLLKGSQAHRLYLQTGYDHGPIADKVIDHVRPRIMSNIVYWFSHHLKIGDSFRERMPVPEIMEVLPVECCPPSGCRVCTRVQVDLPLMSQYDVDEVEVQFSRDNARSFVGRPGKREDGRTYIVTIESLTPEEFAKTLYFAETVFRPLGQVRRFRVSAPPHIPSGFVPKIWPDARLR